MGSSAVIYMLSFRKAGLGIQMLLRRRSLRQAERVAIAQSKEEKWDGTVLYGLLRR
jgi:hypothetical protein